MRMRARGRTHTHTHTPHTHTPTTFYHLLLRACQWPCGVGSTAVHLLDCGVLVTATHISLHPADNGRMVMANSMIQLTHGKLFVTNEGVEAALRPCGCRSAGYMCYKLSVTNKSVTMWLQVLRVHVLQAECDQQECDHVAAGPQGTCATS
jgi:hypothetical protein